MNYEKIIEWARGKGIEAEIFNLSTETMNVNIDNHRIHSIEKIKNNGYGVRVVVDGRTGFSYTTENTARAIERCLDNAIRSAKHGKECKGFRLPDGKNIPSMKKDASKKIKDLNVETIKEHIQRLLDTVKSLNRDIFVAEGHFACGVEKTVITNTSGLFAEWEKTAMGIFISTAYPTPEGVYVGFEEAESTDFDVDFEQIGRSAAKLAQDSKNPTKLESGRMHVILTPHAARSILESALLTMFQGDYAMRGESVLTGKTGKKVFAEDLTIIDDGLAENTLSSMPFDDEGVPSQKNILVENGVLKQYIFDALSAAEHGTSSTGNGVRAMRLSAGRTFKNTPSPKMRNFVMRGDTRRLEEILKDYAPCLVVHAVLGAHTANPVTGDFAVNAPIVFEYSNAEFHPKRQGMLSGNIIAWLSQHVVLGNDTRKLYGTFMPTNFEMPSILIPDAQVTGSGN